MLVHGYKSQVLAQYCQPLTRSLASLFGYSQMALSKAPVAITMRYPAPSDSDINVLLGSTYRYVHHQYFRTYATNVTNTSQTLRHGGVYLGSSAAGVSDATLIRPLTDAAGAPSK